MTLLSQMYSPSFRGVPFILSSASTKGGPKTVTHEYPNDERRYVENLGKYEKTFSVNAIISGDNYLTDRDNFIRALDDGSPGILIHPFYGSNSVVCKEWTVEESFSSLGEAQFSITFEITDTAVNPTEAVSAIPKVADLISSIDDGLYGRINQMYGVSSAYPVNFITAQNKIISIQNLFSTFSNRFSPSSAQSQLSKLADLFSTDSPSYTRSGTDMVSAISNTYSQSNQVGDDAKISGDAYAKQFTFGDDDVEIVPGSLQRAERYQNNAAINYIVNLYALIYAYYNYIQATYATSDDLNSVQATLEAQYQKIVTSAISPAQGYTANKILGFETLRDLAKIRYLSSKAFDDIEVNTAKVTIINLRAPTPYTVLTYLYYGEITAGSQIVALNEDPNVSFLNGDVRALVLPASQQVE